MKTKTSDLHLGQRIALELLWGFARLIAVVPYQIKYYVFEPILFFIFCDLLHYRRRVILDNLRRSFPERDERSLRRLARKYYHTLAEMFIDTMNLSYMPPRKIRRYFTIENLDQMRAMTRGRDWIACMAHYGCWELGSFMSYYDETIMAIGIYHPLRSAVLDCFYRRLRTTRYSVPVAKREAMRFYLHHRDTGYNGRRLALGMIADQNPPRRPDAHWYRFLNQDTVFYDGPEQLALRYGMPVLFTDVYRVGRGRYRIRFEQLYDGEEPIGKHAVTERYVRRLERMIQERPELWMWSHRRWKQKHDAEE